MIDYLTSDENYWACDIEADNFLEEATTIWCVCVENIVTGEKHDFTDMDSFVRWYSPRYVMVGHNFIAYDVVMLNRHWKVGIPIKMVVDTYVLSQLYNPTLSGGHSLAAWGDRLKFLKGEYNDFSKLTPEMVEYCQRDVSLTRLLYLRLSRKMVDAGFTTLGCEIEHLAWNIIQNKQRRHGFPFDYEKAHLLYVALRAREKELQDEIYKLWPPELKLVRTFAKARKADGSPSAVFTRHNGMYPKLEIYPDGSYGAWDWVSFNLASPLQRIAKLRSLGWEPTEWNYKTVFENGRRRKVKTNPKVNADACLAFAEVSGIKELISLAKWLVVNNRANTVNSWMDAYNEKTKAIHGKLFIASTLRYRHPNPNSANIPAVRQNKEKETLYGEEGTWAYECRDLFTCGDKSDYNLVGIDAKGIQIRILLNYAYSDDAFKLYTTGDPHVNNAELLGLANKAAAKKFFYTLIMGGQGARLAADQAQFGTRLTAADGDKMKEMMIDTIPGFKELIDRLQTELRRTGRIILCDGTPILVPSPHMVIPYLLQGDESRIMKLAMRYIDEGIRRERMEAWKVADIHDEGQYVSSIRDTSAFVDMALPVFPRVGEFFKYVVPIEGSAKVGKTWANTH